MITRRSAVLSVALAFMAACGHRKHRTASIPKNPKPSAPPLAVAPGYTEEGIASWYGIPYHGRPAADGEIYNMEALVAAHRTMPFNTWLRVTNLSNSKSVDVRIIDRGPFVDGRIIDLSKAAARDIDLLGPGVGRVRLEVISAPVDNPCQDFYAVQVGAFSVEEHADTARSTYAAKYGSAQVELRSGRVPMWRVLVGKEPSITAAQDLARTLTADNKNVFVVRLDRPAGACAAES